MSGISFRRARSPLAPKTTIAHAEAFGMAKAYVEATNHETFQTSFGFGLRSDMCCRGADEGAHEGEHAAGVRRAHQPDAVRAVRGIPVRSGAGDVGGKSFGWEL